jgi:hypothetical protein
MPCSIRRVVRRDPVEVAADPAARAVVETACAAAFRER